MGLIGQFFTTPTAIIASFGTPQAQRTRLIRVQPDELNRTPVGAGRCREARVCGRADATKGLRAHGKRPTYPWWPRVLGCAIVSAACARFLDSGQNDVILGDAVGLVIGLLALAFKRRTISSHVFEPTAAIVGSALVSIAAAHGFRGYRGLTMLLSQDVEVGLSAAMTEALTAFALAGGLIVANVLVPPTS